MLVTIYQVAAVVGSVILLIQFALALIGGDTEVQVDADIDIPDHGEVGAGLGLISLRTIVAFLAFFGLGGLAADRAGWDSSYTILAAIGSGLLAFYLVAWLMLKLHQLQSSGNIEIENAVGLEAGVYLHIPAEAAGKGKVTVNVQGRRIQCAAITRGPDLPTGSSCRIVAVQGKDTLIVEPTSIQGEDRA